MNDNAAPSFSASENGLTINEPIEPEKREAAEPQKAKKPKKVLSLKLIFGVIIIGLIVFAATQIDYVAVVDNISATGYEPSEEMAALISDLSLTSDGERIMNASRPELQEAEQFNQNCNSVQDADDTSTLGCYSERRIYIYNIARADLEGIRQVTLAHEFLHAVWERMSRTEQDSLRDSLQSIYDTNEDIRKHIDNYRDDERLNELHSAVGSQLSPNDMPTNLRDHYAKYFSNHSKIAAFYNQYNSIFEEMKRKEEDLKEKITEHLAKVKEMREAYDRANASLSEDVSDFNSRSRNGGFSSQEEWMKERQSLLDRQSAQWQSHQEITNYINETNALIAEYNENAVRVTELYKSIDSTVNQPSNTTE